MDFTTKLTTLDIDIYGINKFLELDNDIDVSIESATATIYWSLEMDAREWGVKDLSVIINKVTIGIEVEYWEGNDDESDKIYKDFEFLITDSKLIKNEIKIIESSIYPSNIEIYLDSKNYSVVVIN